MSKNTAEPTKGRGFIKGAGKAIALPFTLPFKSVVGSASLARESLHRTKESAVVIKDISLRAAENIKSSGRKGRDDSFDSIFHGQEGHALRQYNIKRFLLRKRLAIAMLVIFTLYGMTAVVVFHQIYGLLTFIGGVLFGAIFCFESQFRLWQLRNGRLSMKEKGGVKSFLSESPLLGMFNPELIAGIKK